MRHRAVAGEPVRDASAELAITVTTDEAANTITITDNGIGMDKSELIENLGTIARSGSRAFLAKLRDAGAAGAPGATDASTNIIGQFGVGFYSCFMVADAVEVTSLGAAPDAVAHVWTSTGDGAYEIAPAAAGAAPPRGTRVVMRLKDSAREFSSATAVKEIVTRHSNFVNFPILLNGKQANTVRALWTLPKSEVSDEAYTAFYKYKSGDFDAPLYRLHFSADAPTNIKALLFVGKTHDEKYGMGRVKPGTDLYSRKVLIEAGSGVLPEWLRFVSGVVDSEDVPLNISRETMQDSALLKRLRAVLTRRVLRFFDAEARKDAETYNTRFFPEFGQFLKEGSVTDAAYAGDIAKLLRFESSGAPAGALTSLDEYVSRMPPGQSDIYYLVAPQRGIAEASPYMEAFKGRGAAGGDVEVLFLYSTIDDFVMNNLREFNGRKFTTAETANLDPKTLQGQAAGSGAGAADAGAAAGEAAGAAARLTPAQVTELGGWLVSALPHRLSAVRATDRLRGSPAVVTDHESASLRRMMRMVESTAGKDEGAVKMESHMLPKQTLEVNPAHAVIVKLHALSNSDAQLAKVVAEQLVDNALVAAGLVDDPRTMLPRLAALLEVVVGLRKEGADAFPAAPETKRWVSPVEADEREQIAVGEEVADAIAAVAKATKATKA